MTPKEKAGFYAGLHTLLFYSLVRLGFMSPSLFSSRSLQFLNALFELFDPIFLIGKFEEPINQLMSDWRHGSNYAANAFNSHSYLLSVNDWARREFSVPGGPLINFSLRNVAIPVERLSWVVSIKIRHFGVICSHFKQVPL